MLKKPTGSSSHITWTCYIEFPGKLLLCVVVCLSLSSLSFAKNPKLAPRLVFELEKTCCTPFRNLTMLSFGMKRFCPWPTHTLIWQQPSAAPLLLQCWHIPEIAILQWLQVFSKQNDISTRPSSILPYLQKLQPLVVLCFVKAVCRHSCMLQMTSRLRQPLGLPSVSIAPKVWLLAMSSSNKTMTLSKDWWPASLAHNVG